MLILNDLLDATAPKLRHVSRGSVTVRVVLSSTRFLIAEVLEKFRTSAIKKRVEDKTTRTVTLPRDTWRSLGAVASSKSLSINTLLNEISMIYLSVELPSAIDDLNKKMQSEPFKELVPLPDEGDF